MEPGTLYLVATPIGNLEDITLRALRILKYVDLILCEDTRRTSRLLNHYGVRARCVSHHEHNEEARTPELVRQLRAGKNMALVTDAGSPLLSDPGYALVSACRREEVPVTSVPGPSAAVAALTASGLATDNFFFVGFLPARASARLRKLQELSTISATLVFYEAPHRLIRSLEDMAAILGPRRACLARELTKVHEEWLRGRIQEILDTLKERPKILGEATLVIEGGSGGLPAVTAQPGTAPLRQQVEEEMRQTGKSRNEALKAASRRLGITRKEAYKLLLEEKE